MKKRLAVYCIYDKEGIVDEYIFYQLNALKKICSDICIVINGFALKEYIKRLHEIANVVFERENFGLDAGAYRDVLINRLGWENVIEYDELILQNDTCFGPFFPLEESFSQFESGDFDLWGYSYVNPTQGSRYLPHIQSYFLSFSSKALHSNWFKTFINQYTPSNDKKWTVMNFEMALSKIAIENKMKIGAYLSPNKIECSELGNMNYIYSTSYNVIKCYRFPFLKRILLKLPETASDNTQLRKTISYIDKYTDYDIDLIYKHLIRINDPFINYTNLGLHFTFDSKHSYRELPKNKKIGIFSHLFYDDLFYKNLEYFREIPNDIDIYISVKNEKDKKYLSDFFDAIGKNNYTIVVVENRGRDVGALYLGFKEYFLKYDYACWVHDKANASINVFWNDYLFETIIGSAQYIQNVIDCFEKNPRIGVLSSHLACRNTALSAGKGLWKQEKENTIKLINKIGLRCKLSDDTQPLCVSHAFWCRPAAIQPIFDYGFTYEDFAPEPIRKYGETVHAIERLLPFSAQHMGYFSGLVSDIENNNSKYISLYFSASEAREKEGFIIKRMLRNDNWRFYIYGCGAVAKRFYEIYAKKGFPIERILGFVVSEGKAPTPKSFCGHEVKELQELDSSSSILVCIGKELRDEINEYLILNNFFNFVNFNDTWDFDVL